MHGREFGDQVHAFSCLSILHNAVVAWNTIHIGRVVNELRSEGQALDETTLRLTTPLLHKHINPFGKYHFDVERMRQTIEPIGCVPLMWIFGCMCLMPLHGQLWPVTTRPQRSLVSDRLSSPRLSTHDGIVNLFVFVWLHYHVERLEISSLPIFGQPWPGP